MVLARAVIGGLLGRDVDDAVCRPYLYAVIHAFKARLHRTGEGRQAARKRAQKADSRKAGHMTMQNSSNGTSMAEKR